LFDDFTRKGLFCIFATERYLSSSQLFDVVWLITSVGIRTFINLGGFTELLGLDETCVGASTREKLVVCSFLEDKAIPHHVNHIGTFNGRQPMCNGDRGPA
jgi:hypothetical protein